MTSREADMQKVTVVEFRNHLRKRIIEHAVDSLDDHRDTLLQIMSLDDCVNENAMQFVRDVSREIVDEIKELLK